MYFSQKYILARAYNAMRLILKDKIVVDNGKPRIPHAEFHDKILFTCSCDLICYPTERRQVRNTAFFTAMAALIVVSASTSTITRKSFLSEDFVFIYAAHS